MCTKLKLKVWLSMRKKCKIITYVSLKNVCLVIETLKTGHMSTKNVNKNVTEHQATHKRIQHNAKKLLYRHLNSSSVMLFKCHVKTWENSVLYRSFRFANDKGKCYGKRLHCFSLSQLKREPSLRYVTLRVGNWHLSFSVYWRIIL